MCVLKSAPSGDVGFLDVLNRQFFNAVAELYLISSFKNYSAAVPGVKPEVTFGSCSGLIL